MKKVLISFFVAFLFVSVVHAEDKNLDYLGGRYENRAKWESIAQKEHIIIFLDKSSVKFLKDVDGVVSENIILTIENFYYSDGFIKKEVQEELGQEGYFIEHLDLGYEVQKVFYDLTTNRVTVMWRIIYDKNNQKVYEVKLPQEDSYVTFLNDIENKLKFRKIKRYVEDNYEVVLLNTNET